MKIILLSLLFIPLIIPAYAISEYDFIVFTNSTGIYAENTKTGIIQFSGNDAAKVIQDTAMSAYPAPSPIFVKSGTYELKSQLQGWNDFVMIGSGIDQTIFKRNFNQTYGHTISVTSNYNFRDGYAILRDFTVDGNYPNIDNLQDEIALSGRGEITNVKIKNFNAIGIQAGGKILLDKVTIIGVNSSDTGSTIGIWTTPDSDVIITNSKIQDMRIPAIFSQGIILITDSIFENNHLQTYPTGGGHIAVGNSAIVKGNIIRGGNSVTSGIETNQGNYIISENILSNLWNGIVTNGQVSKVLVSNNIILNTTNSINQHGQAIFYNSNNVS